MPKDVAIVLCNGSLNSAVAAALAAQRQKLVTLFVDVAPETGELADNGSPGRAQRGGAGGGGGGGGGGGAGGAGGWARRRAAYDGLVDFLKPFREHTVAMPFLAASRRGRAGQSNIDARLGVDLASRLLALTPLVGAAAKFAAHYEAAAVSLGLQVGPDGPDLARATEYVQVFNELIQLPCGQRDIEVITPLLELEPWQVVDLGIQVGCPMERSWSCLGDGAEPCGVCAGCRARDAAFEQAGKADALRKKA